MRKFQGPTPRKIMRPEIEELPSSDSDSEGDDPQEKAHREAVQELDKCQAELADLEDKGAKEILVVEGKYSKMRKPLYAKREEAIEKVPNFWRTAIINHPELGMLVDEEEEDCFSFLTKVDIQEEETAGEGFWIKFVFDDNPFFENRELVKVFQMGACRSKEEHFEPKSSSTVINWKEGKNLLNKLEDAIKERRKRGLEAMSFFNWFIDNQNPTEDNVAEWFKDDLWPNPLNFYLYPGGVDDDVEEEEEEDEEEMEGEEAEEDLDEDGGDEANNPEGNEPVVGEEEGE